MLPSLYAHSMDELLASPRCPLGAIGHSLSAWGHPGSPAHVSNRASFGSCGRQPAALGVGGGARDCFFVTSSRGILSGQSHKRGPAVFRCIVLSQLSPSEQRVLSEEGEKGPAMLPPTSVCFVVLSRCGGGREVVEKSCDV